MTKKLSDVVTGVIKVAEIAHASFGKNRVG